MQVVMLNVSVMVAYVIQLTCLVCMSILYGGEGVGAVGVLVMVQFLSDPEP